MHERNADQQRDAVCAPIFDPIKDKLKDFKGYHNDANLGLSCGFPFDHAGIKAGDTVLDLGCAAGIDSFIAGTMTGEKGKVLGIDLTPALIDRANQIAQKEQLSQVTFEVEDMEQFDRGANWVDVVISNGVFSLSPDLDSAFAKAYKALKPNGIFCMSDINKKAKFKENTYLKVKEFTGCLNGIRYQKLYLEKMAKAGFQHIEIVEERIVNLPEHIIPHNEEHGLFITTFKMTK